MESTTGGSYGLRENLGIFFRYQNRIKAVFFTTVLISVVGSFLVSKVYEADAKILIRHYREAKIITTSNIPGNVHSREAKERVLSEIQIFKSAVVFEKTVKRLNPDVVLEKMRWRWDWLRELPGKIKESCYNALWLFGPTKSLLPWLGKKKEAPGSNVRMAMTKISDKLSLEPVKGTNVFVVIFEAPDPNFATLVVNTMVEIYQDFHLELRQGTRENKIFSEQVERLRQELRDAKEKLLKLKHENGIISVNLQIKLLLERMDSNQAATQTTRLKKIETELQVQELERQLSKQPKTIYMESSWIRSPVLDSLTKKLSKLESEKSLYIIGSASAIRLKAEIELIKHRIKKEGSIVRDVNKSGINPVYQEIQKELSLGNKELQGVKITDIEQKKKQHEFERRLKLLDNKRILIYEQELEIEIKDQALRLYSKKQEENIINSILTNQKISDITPLELAEVPISASKPSKIKNLIIGIIVGLAGGFLVAYISEFFRRSLVNKEEVESFLKYPCFTAFQLLDDNKERKAETHNLCQLKVLDESVRQLNRQTGAKSILISSARAGEGKSMIASALAVSLTQKKSRVLLINDEHTKQNSQSISNKEVSKHQKDKILATEGNEFIFTINNTYTLSEMIKKYTAIEFEEFFSQLKDGFDFIIIDAPAMYVVPEIITLASIIDSVIFIVEAESTSRISIVKTLERLKQAGANISGIVLNKRTFIIPEWIYDWLLLLNKK